MTTTTIGKMIARVWRARICASNSPVHSMLMPVPAICCSIPLTACFASSTKPIMSRSWTTSVT